MKKAIFWLLLVFMAAGCAHAEEITLSFIGDCSIGESYDRKGQKEQYTWMVDQKGYDWPFSLVRPILDADDYTFANLEIVLTERKQHTNKKYNLVAAPKYAKVLTESGIDAMNTVNNHCWDFFKEGYQDTLSALDAVGMPHFGSVYVGSKTNQQDQLLTAEVKGVKIGALGFTYPQDSDLKLIQQRIQTLRKEGCALVIVSLHWGTETQPYPNSWQFTYAKKVLDAGADMIWGHHPHVLQQIMLYKGKLILFSTGNFTFGTMSSSVDRDTGIFQVTFQTTDSGAAAARLRVIPCRTTGVGDYRPYELTAQEDRERVFKKLIYTRTVKEMANLPAAFAATGTASIQDGVFVEE